MLAVDTNVVVRFLTRDDPLQSALARDLFSQNDIWLGVTVLLETEWVLRSVYRYSQSEISAAFRSLAGLRGLQIEDLGPAHAALGHYDQRMDFADALHLTRAPRADCFVTFDKRFLEAAKQLGLAVRAP